MTVISLRAVFGDEAGVLREQDFQILLLAAMLLPAGNGVLSPVLNSLVGPFGTSVESIGLLISAFWLPGIVVTPVVGVLADRYGRKVLFVPSLVLYGLAGVAITLTTDFRVALALRLLQGIGWAGLTVLIVTSIGDLYSGMTETTAQGLRMTGVGVGGASLSVIAGVVVVGGWRYPFLLYLLVLPVAVAAFLWMEESTTGSDDDAPEDGDDGYGWELFAIVWHPRVLAIVVARALPVVGFLGFVTYNSVIVVELLDGTPAQAGLLYGVWSVVYASIASQLGRVTDLIGGRYRALVLANGCLGGGLVMIFFAPGLLVAGVGTVVMGVGFGVASPTYISLITAFAPESLRAGLVSLSATGSRITAVSAPVVMGVAIAALTRSVGFAPAVRYAGLGAAVVSGGGGVLCVLVASAVRPVQVTD